MSSSKTNMTRSCGYKDLPAVEIESDLLKATYLPYPGAKMASLIYKPLGKELLVQRSNRTYLTQPFDGDYVSAEVGGFDDLFPTVDRWIYDQYPWDGTVMSDHGEVWSLPWTCEVTPEELFFLVDGIRFPYTLQKRISIPEANTIRIDYSLINRSEFDLNCIWAAHIMLNLEPEAYIEVPADNDNIYLTFDMSKKFGGYGTRYSYPEDQIIDGSTYDFSQLNSKDTGNCYKYYFSDPLSSGVFSVHFPKSKYKFTCTFPEDKIPYLGLLPNEGGWESLYNLFIEPCTAPLDRPDRARDNNRQFLLRAKTTFDWYLDLRVEEI